MTPIQEIRPSPIAGTWYPGDVELLARQVDRFLTSDQPAEGRDVEPAAASTVLGLITPHAGYRYSGQTAGRAFQSVQGKSYELVAILSPFHDYHPAPLLTTAHKAYLTPLGPVGVDHEAIFELNRLVAAETGIGLVAVANDREHALEIELPFLQRSLAGDFLLLPVMLHTLEKELVFALGRALAEVLKGRTALMVASTDLSHFYPVETAGRLDAYILGQMEDLSPEGILQAEYDGLGFACGAGAAAAVILAAKLHGANRARVLHYSTSAEETHDRASVVGYGAVAIYKDE